MPLTPLIPYWARLRNEGAAHERISLRVERTLLSAAVDFDLYLKRRLAR